MQSYEAPVQVTQSGIASAVGIERRHVAQYVRPLLASGLVEERVAHVQGGRQSRKVYFLSHDGRREAVRLQSDLLGRLVNVAFPDGTPETLTIREAAKRCSTRLSLLGLLGRIDSGGRLTLPEALPHRTVEGVPDLLERAQGHARTFEWSKSADEYERCLSLAAADDHSHRARIGEGLGDALHRAALQETDTVRFRERIERGAETVTEAAAAYDRAGDPGRAARCRARAAYAAYWLAGDARDKRARIEESWAAMRSALEAFQDRGDSGDLLRTFTLLELCPSVAWTLEWDFGARTRLIEEAVHVGEGVVASLTPASDPAAAAAAHVRLGGTLGLFAIMLRPFEERQRYYDAATSHWAQAVALSEEAALLTVANPMEGFLSFTWGVGSDHAVRTFRRALEVAERTGDNLRIGACWDWLAFHTFAMADRQEDPARARRLLDEALDQAHRAARCYAPLALPSTRAGLLFWVDSPEGEYYAKLADWETDPGARRALARRAMEACPEQLEKATRAGYIHFVGIAHHVASLCRTLAAQLEPDPVTKGSLLDEALAHRRESMATIDRIMPFDYLGQGWHKHYAADILFAQAEIASDPATRRAKLEEALDAKRLALDLFMRELELHLKLDSIWHAHFFGSRHYEYGMMLVRAHEWSGDRESLVAAATAFGTAADLFRRAEVATREAEAWWRSAEVHAALGDHLKSAEAFLRASETYKLAAERIELLRPLYQDHALYMQAWSEIERAKYHHARQEYGDAREYWERAATLHGLTARWHWLAPTYAAWGEVERAEESSRKGEDEPSIEAFRSAIALFRDGEATIQANLDRVRDPQERQMASDVVAGAGLRRRYCEARATLEQGRQLERRGDYGGSAEKYGEAAVSLEALLRDLESEQDRREIEPIAVLARAWEAMSLAEVRADAGLFDRAAALFDRVKDLATTEKARPLNLGSSHFCRALAAGLRFKESRDRKDYAAAAQNFDTSADYYLRAGIGTAADYAKASRLFLEAQLYLGDAVAEREQERRVRLYVMAERVLQAAAIAFAKSEQRGKREQVLRLLERVEEDRDLALSLTEVLKAPVIVSATDAFATPSPTRERATGLDRFEHADVQMSLTVGGGDVGLGESTEIRIELVNAGSTPGRLIRIDDALPAGFEPAGDPQGYRLEGTGINLAGRRLDPLKRLDLIVQLRAAAAGRYELKPRVWYTDELGTIKMAEPEGLTLAVR